MYAAAGEVVIFSSTAPIAVSASSPPTLLTPRQIRTPGDLLVGGERRHRRRDEGRPPRRDGGDDARRAVALDRAARRARSITGNIARHARAVLAVHREAAQFAGLRHTLTRARGYSCSRRAVVGDYRLHRALTCSARRPGSPSVGRPGDASSARLPAAGRCPTAASSSPSSGCILEGNVERAVPSIRTGIPTSSSPSRCADARRSELRRGTSGAHRARWAARRLRLRNRPPAGEHLAVALPDVARPYVVVAIPSSARWPRSRRTWARHGDLRRESCETGRYAARRLHVAARRRKTIFNFRTGGGAAERSRLARGSWSRRCSSSCRCRSSRSSRSCSSAWRRPVTRNTVVSSSLPSELEPSSRLSRSASVAPFDLSGRQAPRRASSRLRHCGVRCLFASHSDRRLLAGNRRRRRGSPRDSRRPSQTRLPPSSRWPAA